jgi:hypothetical protein
VKRRSVLVAAGWLGAVVLAVLAGLGAINVIGAGLTSGGDQPKTAAVVQRELADLPVSSPPETAPPTTATTTPTAPAEIVRTLKTSAGTVVASCSAGGATILSMSPVSPYTVHEKRQAEGEFRSSRDNHDRVKFTVTCEGGTPVLSNRSGGSDD